MLLLIIDTVTLVETPSVFFIRVLGQVIEHVKSCLGTETITSGFHKRFEVLQDPFVLSEQVVHP
jgi:hypothetical protein